MPKSIISYDKDLPEISDRRPWEKPTSFLVKDPTVPDGWQIDDSGRRPSKLLLINKLRDAVDQWREQDYPGASKVTKRLFEYWFAEDHEVPGFPIPFRYHFCQREAIEALAYLVEVRRIRDTKVLVDAFAEVFSKGLFEKNLEYETTMDGKRRLRRYLPEKDDDGVQDLPPENLPRYAFKMATGSGKTWVMAMVVVWSHFQKLFIPTSPLSTNFLILAPNVIVYQRLERDFGSNRIFYELPLIPPEWRGSWSQKVILRGESIDPDPSSNLFLTNIQQLYESRERDKAWTPLNAVEALLGRKPVQNLSAQQPSLRERLGKLRDLVVLNDEAHHVHDEDLAWSQALLDMHSTLPDGLALWLDFSATPKDQAGTYYPWTIVDYPLAQAVEDRIVKAPLIVTKEDDPKHPTADPEDVTKDNVTEKYGFWIAAAMRRWREHYQTYQAFGTKPVLFIMAEKNAFADAIGDYLLKTKEFGLKKEEVLIIHTKSTGEVSEGDLEEARAAARDVDQAESKIKVIVSVLMLREGWDVRNVSVVLGLRPFTARAEILPEQVIGRGLRLMTGVSPDHTQTLEVLGTQNLLTVLREKLEAEGVGIGTTKTDPSKPIIIEPVREKIAYDISIPITKPMLTRNIAVLSSLDPTTFDAIYGESDLEQTVQRRLRMAFATTETEVHREDVKASELPIAQVLLSSITNKVMQRARLSNMFAQLYPMVRSYISTRCYGKLVDVENEVVRTHLNELSIRDEIAGYLSKMIAKLTVEKRTLEFEKANYKLSETTPFSWRRNLEPEPLRCGKTIFNFVATYNDFERRFAQFLDRATDVIRFAALGTTEQGESGSKFRVDYLKSSGAIGFYYPDWVAVQQTEQGEVYWIIETKGRVWEGTDAKDAAIQYWCDRVSEQTKKQWRYVRVNQAEFDLQTSRTLEDVTKEKVTGVTQVAKLIE